MPFLLEKKIGNNRLLLWLLEESIEELEVMLPYSLVGYSSAKSQSRRRETIVENLLVNKAFGCRVDIGHLESGKPYLINNDLNISISHSRNMVGLYIGTAVNIGLDIEQTGRNVSKLLIRFLSKREYEKAVTSPDYIKITYWCTKEAVFKSQGQSDVDFASEIEVTEIMPVTSSEDMGTIKATSLDKRTMTTDFVELFYFQMLDNIVVVTK